jgi:phosphatidylserine/phosphatidylglycerophosphate/cardiolipin synthase-like enzyme
MNFVTRREVTLKNPVIRAKWRITVSGRNYLTYVDSHPHPESIPYTPPEVRVLLVAPEHIRKQVRAAAATDLSEALSDLLASAKEEVLVSSPYIDEVIVPLIRVIPSGCAVRILTESADRAFFTRLVQSRPNLEIRVLRKVTSGNVQLFQVHAKFLIVDESSAIVTSANLNERSLYYNVEIGVLIPDRGTCKDMADVFNAIYKTGIPI